MQPLGYSITEVNQLTDRGENQCTCGLCILPRPAKQHIHILWIDIFKFGVVYMYVCMCTLGLAHVAVLRCSLDMGIVVPTVRAHCVGERLAASAHPCDAPKQRGWGGSRREGLSYIRCTVCVTTACLRPQSNWDFFLNGDMAQIYYQEVYLAGGRSEFVSGILLDSLMGIITLALRSTVCYSAAAVVQWRDL